MAPTTRNSANRELNDTDDSSDNEVTFKDNVDDLQKLVQEFEEFRRIYRAEMAEKAEEIQALKREKENVCAENESLRLHMQDLEADKQEDRCRMQQELDDLANANNRLRNVNLSATQLGNGSAVSSNNSRSSFSRCDMPMPKQSTFNGKGCWESFSKGFEKSADRCGWDEDEKLYRLTNCLRDYAAEYALKQLPEDISSSYSMLLKALGERFKDDRPASSYISELDNKKLGVKESASEYVSNIQYLVFKGYPTADVATREAIGVRQFLKGLTDQNMIITLGMKELSSLDEAKKVLEKYMNLKTDSSHKIRVVNEKADERQQYVSKKDLEAFGEQLFDKFEQKLKSWGWNQGQKQYNKVAKDECYSCHLKGHHIKDCPTRDQSSSAGNQGN